jgi:hypothetical protein
MSLKPEKKSDMNKAWKRSRRDRARLISPEYHLIVTEGTKTEPQYFRSISEVINQKYHDKIQLEIHGERKDTLRLLDKAVSRVRNSIKVFKHVWIVYDTDDFPPERINQTVEECKKLTTDETIYHALWSNQCIELWFMLHFNFVESDLHRSEYIPKLTEWLNQIGKGEYEKNREDIYDTLRPYLNDAIRNAKKLDEYNRYRTPSNAAPGTKVYELMELLRPYLDM